MSGNQYGGLIADWKVRLIEARAKRLGFRDDEIPDLQQEIVPQLVEFESEYDETWTASEKTAVKRAIDKHLFKALRKRKRYVRRANYETAPLEKAAGKSCPGMPAIEHCELRLDLEAAMADLSELERAVCEGLLQGDSKTEIAMRYGCSNAAITKALARLRRKLSARGLDEYLG